MIRRKREQVVDRKARDELADLITTYCNDEIPPFQLHKALLERWRDCKDETVQIVIDSLWFHYDDLKDHRAVATKGQWDFFQRLMLLLQSDGHVDITTRRRWTLRQLVAACMLVLFGVAVARMGFRAELLLVTVLLGVVSMLLSDWPNRVERRSASALPQAAPFASVAELLAVRRKLPTFAKRCYRPDLQHRRIRGRFDEAVPWLYWRAVWLALSPVALLFQCLPDIERTYHVLVPSTPSVA